MSYGEVEEPSSSRSRGTSTARRSATSAILTVILSRSDRASRNSRMVNARPGWDADLERLRMSAWWKALWSGWRQSYRSVKPRRPVSKETPEPARLVTYTVTYTVPHFGNAAQ